MLISHIAHKRHYSGGRARFAAAPVRSAVAAALAFLFAGSQAAETNFETVIADYHNSDTAYEGQQGGNVTADSINGFFYGGDWHQETENWENYSAKPADFFKAHIGIDGGSQKVTIHGGSDGNSNSVSASEHTGFSIYGSAITLEGNAYTKGYLKLGSESTDSLNTKSIELDGGQAVLEGGTISTGSLYYNNAPNLYKVSGTLSAASESDEKAGYFRITSNSADGSVTSGEVQLNGIGEFSVKSRGDILFGSRGENGNAASARSLVILNSDTALIQSENGGITIDRGADIQSSGNVSLTAAGDILFGSRGENGNAASAQLLSILKSEATLIKSENGGITIGGVSVQESKSLTISSEADASLGYIHIHASEKNSISSSKGKIAADDVFLQGDSDFAMSAGDSLSLSKLTAMTSGLTSLTSEKGNVELQGDSSGYSLFLEESPISITALNGTASLDGQIFVSGSGSSLTVNAKEISADRVRLTNGASVMSLTASDNAEIGWIRADGVKETSTIRGEGSVDIGASPDPSSLGYGIDLVHLVSTDGTQQGLSVTGGDVTIHNGIVLSDASFKADAAGTLLAEGKKSTSGGNSVTSNWAVNILNSAQSVTLGSDSTSRTIINGGLNLKNAGSSSSISMLGKNVTISAASAPITDGWYSSKISNIALRFNVGNFNFQAGSDKTDSLTINGDIQMLSSGNVALDGRTILVNGDRTDLYSGSEASGNRYTIYDPHSASQVTIGSERSTSSLTYIGTLMPSEGSSDKKTVYSLHGDRVLVDNENLAAVMVYRSDSQISIGDESGSSTAIRGSLISGYTSNSSIQVHGKAINIGGAMLDTRLNQKEKGNWGLAVYNRTDDGEGGTEGVPESEAGLVRDAVIFASGGGMQSAIGDDGSSAVDISGRVLALYYSPGTQEADERYQYGALEEARISGSSIRISDLESRSENVVVAAGMSLDIGSDSTKKADIEGGIIAYGNGQHDSLKRLTVKGASVLINPAEGKSAVQALNGSQVTVGSSAGGEQDAVVINGESLITGAGTALTVLGSNIAMNPNGRSHALHLSGGASAGIGTDSTLSAAISGPAEASDSKLTVLGKRIDLKGGLKLESAEAAVGGESTQTAALGGRTEASGSSRLILGTQADSVLLTGSVALSGDSSAEIGSESTVLLSSAGISADAGSTAAVKGGAGSLVTGRISDASLSGVTLRLTDGAVWAPDSGSALGRLSTHNASVTLANGKLGDRITLGSWDDDPSTLTLEVNSRSNSGNDTVCITGAHSGDTVIQLVSADGSPWTSAMENTVLVRMGEELGSFTGSQTQASDLYFYKLGIAERGTSSQSDLADGYTAEAYISSVTQSATDSSGRYTAPVQELASAAGTNYTLWRSTQDTLMRRLGDVHEGLSPDGLHTVWARAHGARFAADSGSLGWKTSWSAFEGGLDLAAFASASGTHYAGFGFAYIDASSSYSTGRGESDGVAFGLYDTYVRNDGQHLDAVFKVTHLATEVRGAGGTGRLSNTGLTLGAEYGWKLPLGGGFFAEPQAQLTLGWMDSGSFTSSRGIHTSVDSAFGAWTRAGVRAGWEAERVQLFAKADWNRDFGGDVDAAFSEGSERLGLSHGFGTGWLEYGAGLAVSFGRSGQLWLQADRGHGGSGAPEWAWNAGLRWSF